VLAELGRTQEVLDDPLRPPVRLQVEARNGADGILKHLSDVLPMGAADLARKLGLPFAEVLGRLTRLELDGMVNRYGPGYVRIRRRD
jgi:predicted Rossmann fold nucleotide-binding protein DprA/Smf involved in DNA uptake